MTEYQVIIGIKTNDNRGILDYCREQVQANDIKTACKRAGELLNAVTNPEHGTLFVRSVEDWGDYRGSANWYSEL